MKQSVDERRCGSQGRGNLHENEKGAAYEPPPSGIREQLPGRRVWLLQPVLEFMDVYFPIESDMILAVPLGNPAALFSRG